LFGCKACEVKKKMINHLKPVAGNHIYAIVLLLLVIISSCREVYYHDTRHLEDVIIVEGLVSDLEGPHHIKLSYSEVFSEDEENTPGEAYPLPGIRPVELTGATVNVADNHGKIFPFTEESPGHYYSDSTFSGVRGDSYTLIIETPDGEKYESSPQKLPEPVRTDTLVYTDAIRETLLPTYYGRLIRFRTAGREIFSDVKVTDEYPAMYRIISRLLVLYDVQREEVNEFRWKHIPVSDMININSLIRQSENGIIKNHEIGFFPTRASSLGIFEDLGETIVRQFVLISYSSLNMDGWNFYSAAEDQINREDRIFDPASKQLPSNIYCVTDPGRLAIGLFEVSAITNETWLIIEYPWVDFIRFMKVRDLHHIPDRGSGVYGIDNLPDFFFQLEPG